MTFIRYKRFGKKEYAFQVKSYWDPVLKTSRQKSKYLGEVIDKKKKLFRKKEKRRDEKLNLDFGDCYLLHEFLKRGKMVRLLEDVFGKDSLALLALVCYRLCQPSAMCYARVWYEGNVARILFKDLNLASQRISELLGRIGDEYTLRDFFRAYVASFVTAGEGVIIDATALPNQIHLPFSAWGYGDSGIEKQVRFLFVVDRQLSLPIFFRYLPGNVVDVSSLRVSMAELKKFGIRSGFVLVDGGFFSEDNIKGLYGERIDFLTRLPATTKLYKELIRTKTDDLERFKHAVKFGKRVLFVEQLKVDLFGRRAYAHLILDPERKGRELRDLLLEVLDDAEEESEVEYAMKRKGVMVLLSSFKIPKGEIIPLYYMKQTVERLFGFLKDDLKLVPLRVHTEETLRGWLLLSFIALVTFVLLKRELVDYTVEEALMMMRNLKCKVYDDEIIVNELTREQRELTEKLKILVPKSMGI